jgi:hypothetical protein
MTALLAVRSCFVAGGLALMFTLPVRAATPCAATPIYAAPYMGPVNHAHTAPPFQWGAFGAQHHYPQVYWHRDYNGELMRWSMLRRY